MDIPHHVAKQSLRSQFHGLIINSTGVVLNTIEKFIHMTNVSISSGQRNLMKTYHNDANTSRITKIALKIFLDFF